MEQACTRRRSFGRSVLSAALAAAVLSRPGAARLGVGDAARRGFRQLPAPLRNVTRRALRVRRPEVGYVRMGDLASIEPISEDFGWDRGSPIDRHYIEDFLLQNAEDIRGRVLEVGDASYSQRFGADRVTTQDVLHVHSGNPRATIVGDIGEDDVLPEATFDCIVLTQTLHLVFDMPNALRRLYSSLRPGGVLLLTVPHISPIDRGEWGRNWYWGLTPPAVQRLTSDVFGEENVRVQGYGNVYAATAFLQGLAVEEVHSQKIAHWDSAYPIVVAARAVRPQEEVGDG